MQGEGSVADGRRFYFRARYDAWELHLGATTDQALGEPSWSWSEPWGDAPYAAGYMAEDTARAIIESCAEMIVAGVAPPRSHAGVPDDEVKALSLANFIAEDICTYQADEIENAGSGPKARVAVAAQIKEGRALYRAKTDPRFHPLYEKALARIDARATGAVAHAVWLMDADSARSVGRRWREMIVRAPASRRAELEADAVRWLTAWTLADDVRAAWQAELRRV